MRKLLSICILMLLCVSMLSCSTASHKSVFKVEPTDLFAGDKVKFKPFMDHASGVKVQYKGDRESIRLLAEVWVNGELRDIHPHLGGFTTNETKDGLREWNGEVIVSAEVNENEKGHSQYNTKAVFVDGKGSVSHIYSFDADIKHTGFGQFPLNQVLNVSPDDGEVPIWGLQATNRNVLHTMSFDSERLKLTDWAIIFKLSAAETGDMAN